MSDVNDLTDQTTPAAEPEGEQPALSPVRRRRTRLRVERADDGEAAPRPEVAEPPTQPGQPQRLELPEPPPDRREGDGAAATLRPEPQERPDPRIRPETPDRPER
ncbi:MAG TPA: hypothetical protein VFG43_16180, partial [Geminicoccaceae bacterium]|nr:hypothetical protein [Geminicoccaceae bacterium]